MIQDIYCKINEFRATFISLEPQFDTLDSNLDKIVAFIPKKDAAILPVLREHLNCLPKARKKLPEWVNARCIFASTPYEQSTSGDIAAYRAGLFKPGKLLSITGGLGVDDLAFAKKDFKVTSLDTDPALNALFQYNAQQLNISTVNRITTSAEEYLTACTETFDTLFADPDRRASGNRAHGNTATYSPDVFALYHQYPKLATTWVIKLSPMVDLSWLRAQFQTAIDIYVIAGGSEVKEIMVEISGRTSGRTLLVNVKGDLIESWDGENNLVFEKQPGTYFSEPSAACIKAGFHRKLSQITPLESVNANHTFFTGNCRLPGYLGRSFYLHNTLKGSLSEMGRDLSKAGIVKAHITCRDFVLGAEDTRKKLRMADGGEYYLFFTGKKEKTCFVCSREKD